MLLKTPLALCDDMTEGFMVRLIKSGLGLEKHQPV